MTHSGRSPNLSTVLMRQRSVADQRCPGLPAAIPPTTVASRSARSCSPFVSQTSPFAPRKQLLTRGKGMRRTPLAPVRRQAIRTTSLIPPRPLAALWLGLFMTILLASSSPASGQTTPLHERIDQQIAAGPRRPALAAIKRRRFRPPSLSRSGWHGSFVRRDAGVSRGHGGRQANPAGRLPAGQPAPCTAHGQRLRCHVDGAARRQARARRRMAEVLVRFVCWRTSLTTYWCAKCSRPMASIRRRGRLPSSCSIARPSPT